MHDRPLLRADQDFDSFASDQLRELLREIHLAQAERKLVPANYAMGSFAAKMRQLYGQMESACA